MQLAAIIKMFVSKGMKVLAIIQRIGEKSVDGGMMKMCTYMWFDLQTFLITKHLITLPTPEA